MAHELVNLNIKGQIVITFKKDGVPLKYSLIENEVVTNALMILVRCIGGQSTYAIDGIQAYKAGVLLAEAEYFTFSYTPLNQAVFTAIFSPTSFGDTLDELRLISSTGGIFSKVEDLSIEKISGVELALSWKLTLNFE